MRSKIFFLTSAVIASSLLVSCGYKESQRPGTDHSEDNIIGTNLAGVSAVTGESGTDQNKIAMYDATVCRIHQFNLTTNRWERALKPRILGGDHKVMFDPSGNYVIDVVEASFTVFNKDGVGQDPGVTFAGKPKTASFRPSLGYMVMQDDSKTAALVKINGAGNVTGNSTLGQIVYGNVTMLAGDIDDFGTLVLALSDGKIALVDIAQTVSNNTWTITDSFASTLTDINWLAPMHDGSHQILVKTREDSNGDSRIAIFDTVTKAMVGSPYVVPSSRKIIKTSKFYDPHFIVRDDKDANDPTAVSTLVYAQGGVIQTKLMTNKIRNILSSRINITDGTWAIVDTDVWRIWDSWTWHWYHRVAFDDYNIVKSGRVFQLFSLPQGMALLKRYTVADTTDLQIGQNTIFQLYPSKLGLATTTSIMNPANSKPIDDKFNYPYLHEEPCQ